MTDHTDPLAGLVDNRPLPTVYNHDLAMKHIGEGDIIIDRDSLTAWNGAPVPGRTGVSLVYCRECEDMVAPINHTPRSYDPHCPMCRRALGALEHGVDTATVSRLTTN